jgi:stress response protein YsnF
MVNKTAKVTEEAVVRREGTERTETVRDTVRKEEIEVDREQQATNRTP